MLVCDDYEALNDFQLSEVPRPCHVVQQLSKFSHVGVDDVFRTNKKVALRRRGGLEMIKKTPEEGAFIFCESFFFFLLQTLCR